MTQLGKNGFLTACVVFCFWVVTLDCYGEGPKFSWPKVEGAATNRVSRGGGGGAREYFSANLQDLDTIPIHLWGDVPAPGVYYVPTDTTLRTILGYVGGPPNVQLHKTTISLSRLSRPNATKRKEGDLKATHYQLTALDILEQPRWSEERISPDDVIFIHTQVEKPFDFFGFLKDLLTIMGFITSSVSTILVLRRLDK